MEKKLELTKKKLTILFTLIVFFVAIILEFIYFTTKFYSIKNLDLKKFNWNSKNVEINILSGESFINSVPLRMMHKWVWKWIINNFLSNNKINFFVIDNFNNEIIFNRVFEYIDEDILIKNINKIKNNETLYSKWYYFKKSFIKNNFIDYQLIFFKKLDYPISSYLTDLLWFITLSSWFSIIIYFIWILFIWKILKPVEENILDMQNFIHNAWHELKTPISVINSNLQLLNELKIYDEKLTKENIWEIKKLDKLIEWLIELTNINNNQNIENLDIVKQIDEIILNYKKKLISKKIKLEFIKKENIKLNINKQYFYIFFSNILSNAIKYNKKWWNINIILNKNSLQIIDTWDWIDQKDINKIFDRFFKANSKKNIEWFWIWLSLVKKIADIYNWKIKVESKKWEYTKFIILFK